MLKLVDQIGQSHSFQSHPERIVSLVPSQTELLVDLRLRENILGITKFCVHPQDLRREKTVVGGTKQVAIDKIKALHPDIILCNKEENTKEIVEALKGIAPVHVSDITTIEDNLQLIEQYGILFKRKIQAQQLIEEIKQKLKAHEILLEGTRKYSCIYIIWKNPWMVAGNNTFINHLLHRTGFENNIKQDRYPEISLEHLQDVDYVFLSSEPFPFKETHLQEIQSYVSGKIVLVDGEYFSWYGSRIVKAFAYFKKLRTQLEL